MEAVVTGESFSVSSVRPVRFVHFPYMGYDRLSVCRPNSVQQYTLIGLENIIVPGLLIAFCHSFDLARAHGFKIYYFTTLIGKIKFVIFGNE